MFLRNRGYHHLIYTWILPITGVPLVIMIHKAIWYYALAHVLLSFLMGAAIFGREFDLGTMERLLSQPISRKKLWLHRIKILVYTVLIPPLIGFTIILPFHVLHLANYLYRHSLNEFLLNYALTFTLLLFSGLSSGILMSLYIRNTNTAFWASIASTGSAAILWVIIGPFTLNLICGRDIMYGKYTLFFMAGIPLFLWSITAFFLARRKFMRIEV
jgi:ABC-type transport system involved in multi-copper enzyme maturation permease subunit